MLGSVAEKVVRKAPCAVLTVPRRAQGAPERALFSLGFMKTCPSWPFGHAGTFGAPGAGGSLGFADPQTGTAYAYVTNRMGGVTGDPRDLALRNAIPPATANAGIASPMRAAS